LSIWLHMAINRSFDAVMPGL